MEHFYQDLPGGFWFREAYDRILRELPTDRRSVIIEVGSCHGKSAAYLGVEIVNRKLPVTLHLVDNFSWSPVPVADLQAECVKNLTPLGNAMVECGAWIHIHPMTSLEAFKGFPEEYADFIWIDADHSYPGVLADIKAWWPVLKRRGAMGGDDLGMPGVAKAVVETGRYEVGGGWREDAAYKGPWEWWWRRKP